MEERLNRLKRHVAEHPSDYQSVIALLRLRSRFYEKRRRDQMIPQLRKAAKYRRQLNDKDTR